jgi:hypothetical protein
MDARMDSSTTRLTLQNHTRYIAMFVVKRGDMTIARPSGLAPGGVQQVPTTQTYTVVATTVLEGNTYTSAPIAFTGAMRCLARVVQHHAQGTYAFELVAMPSSDPRQLQFEKTSIGPVTFNLSVNGSFLQSVVVDNSATLATVHTGGMYSIYAVINGITTDIASTAYPDAVLAVVENAEDDFAIEIR